MDLEAPLKPEVLRPLITLVVPGTIAIGPFVLITGHYVPAVERFWTQHATAFSVLVALAILATGFVIDDFGTHIEVEWWDPQISSNHPDHDTNWNRYLKLQLKDELIAQRYLRLKLTQMKFELAMAIALPISWTGLLWLNCIFRFWFGTTMGFITIGFVTATTLLLRESLITARLLSRTRALILNAIDDGVKGISGPASTSDPVSQ